jgi:hypothetical protein
MCRPTPTRVEPVPTYVHPVPRRVLLENCICLTHTFSNDILSGRSSTSQNQINNRSLGATDRTEARARERLLPRASFFFFSLFF